MDIIEFDSRDKQLANKIKAISRVVKPEDCFTCLKCTNGCPATKIFSDFIPHKFQLAAGYGLVDEIIESRVLWNCFNCITCQTRCPQLISPVQTICSLTNIAVDRGITPPKPFTEMIKNITKEGAIQTPREVQTTDFEFVSRADLGLPPRGIKNIEKFREALRVVGAYKLLENKAKEDEK